MNYVTATHLLLTLVLLLVRQVMIEAGLDKNESSHPSQSSLPSSEEVSVVDTTHYLERPDGTTSASTDTHLKKLGKRIPLELLKQLQDVASYGELVRKAVEPGRQFSTRSFRSSISSSSLLPTNRLPKVRTNSTNPGEIGPIFDNRAFCQPRRVPVHVPQPADPMLIYQPMCIQIERCGGCCAHELFHCVPSLKRNATRKVVALRYPHAGAEFFEFEKVTTVKIERHARCKCQCKVQPEDCSIHQVYNKDNCRCACPKGTGQLKCKPPQVWHERDCRCRCPDLDDCSTGTYFDPRICRCRSMAEILVYARIYKNPWLKSYIPGGETRPASPPST